MTLSAVAAAIAIAGPGAASIDAALGLDTVLNGWIGGGAVVLGVAVAGVQLAMFFRPEASGQTSGV